MGQATIFNGQKIKTLKDTLTLNGKSDIISSTVDPTASAVDAPIGSLLINQTSGKLYRKLDAGSSVNWEEVGAGVGGINYILNPSAEVNTTGWATYADAAGAAPVDGTGGSPNVTWTRSTTTPLRGVADFNFVKDAANRQGQGVSYDFTIALADKAKVLSVTFDYEVLSGTYADGDLTVYLIADPAGTPVVIQPAGYTVLSATSGTTMRQRATFQTQATGTSYRLCFHVASTSASAYTLAIDNVVVGPQQTVQGAAISDWVSYTPTWSSASNPQPAIGSGSVIGRYRRVGDSYEVQITIQGSSSGTVTTWGTGGYSFSLPAAADTSKVSILAGVHVLGQASALRQFTGWYSGSITFNGTGNAVSIYGPSATVSVWGSTSPTTWASNDTISIEFTYPVAGLSSNTVLSQDTDTRVVAARAISSTTGAWPTSDTVVNFATVSYDTHSVITTGAGWNYRIPVSGYYKVSASHEATSSGATTLILRIRKNGSQFATGTFPMNAATSNIIVRVDGQNFFNAGDTIDIAASSTAGTGAFVGSASASVVQIERLSGPATIAASETVAASAGSAAGGTVADATLTFIDFPISAINTHGAILGAGSGNSTTYTNTWRFVAPTSGIYSVSANLTFVQAAGVSTAFDFLTIIAKNGVGILNGQRTFLPSTSPSTPYGSNVSGLIRLNAGDTISVIGYHDNPGNTSRNLEANSAANFVSIVRVGN